ncbi:Lrp/AsnC family transcriptional regulator [Nocardia terpenica]|uniref:AsnC family transcriptional regulator n=1 Tax=Nocardia terpenica TaxID=455432 RepID=A0A6G9ZBG4_9NOCA|nr:AsnC family transcriptional regulator [Nocardia terpenica]QIS22959.1 AsnC family transcriptional regulator [Nocardia terpenica]
MTASSVRGIVFSDPLDAQIVHALQLDPRAPFSRIAADLGVAEQTVARRYRRLRRDGAVRVIGAVDPRALGENDWMIRVRCRPDGAAAVAEALAGREDASWISIGAAGAEVTFSLHPRSAHERDDLLVQRLRRSAPVHDVQAAMILQRFVRHDVRDWRGRRYASGTRDSILADGDSDSALHDTDRTLLELLARDGRTSYSALARATGTSIGRVTRRIAALQAGGILYFDLDIAPAATDYGCAAFLWLRVAPPHWQSVGQALADHEEASYVAAISGSFNILACLDTVSAADLFPYVNTRIAALEGIHGFELVPVLQRVKQAGARTVNGRLVPPAPAPARPGPRRRW